LQEAVKQLLQKLRQATKFVRAQRQLVLAGVMLLLSLRDAAPNSVPVEVLMRASSVHVCLLCHNGKALRGDDTGVAANFVRLL